MFLIFPIKRLLGFLKQSLPYGRLLGVAWLMLFVCLFPCCCVGYVHHESIAPQLLICSLVFLIVGSMLWYSINIPVNHWQPRDGFLVVALFWLVFTLLAAVPLYWANVGLNYASCWFEAVSAATTTGSSAFSHVDNLPHTILLYRANLQFIGGMGILILAIAILPAMGIGGLQLFRAEVTGPFKDNVLTPRVALTAKNLWMIYIGLNLSCILCYHLAGMNWFDAVCHAFATISTGGMTTHDQSIGFFHQPAVALICIVFMIMGGMNFNLHYLFFVKNIKRTYLNDAETRSYLFILIFSTFLVALAIHFHGQLHFNQSKLWLQAAFQTVSSMTTTGFNNTDCSQWPDPAVWSVLLIGLIGGCSGSTSGAMKVLRFRLLWQQIIKEIRTLVYPHGVFVLHYDDRVLSQRLLDTVWAFAALYTAGLVFFWLLLMFCGIPAEIALGSVMSSLANVGLGMGHATGDYHHMSKMALIILSSAMLFGRLELFTFMVIFHKSFWRTEHVLDRRG